MGWLAPRRGIEPSSFGHRIHSSPLTIGANCRGWNKRSRISGNSRQLTRKPWRRPSGRPTGIVSRADTVQAQRQSVTDARGRGGSASRDRFTFGARSSA